MRAGAREAEARRGGGGEVGARLRQLGGRLRHGRVRRGDDLELRGGHLDLEARVAERLDDLGGVRREVERLGVEQHHLLFEADRPRPGALECGPQVGIAHGP